MSKVKIPKITMEDISPTVFMLHGVRLSFPNLWTPGKDYENPKELKKTLDSNFMIPLTEKALIKKIMVKFIKAARTVNGKVKRLSQTKNPKFMRPKMKDSEELEDFYVVKTVNSMKYPPRYINCHGKVHKGDPLEVGADAELYGGCYVSIKVELNPEILATGKTKVWCGLVAIQFVQDGEPFGKAITDDEAESGFGQVKSQMSKAKSTKSKAKPKSKVEDDFDDEFDDEFDDDLDDDDEFDDDEDDDLDDDDEFDDDDFDL